MEIRPIQPADLDLLNEIDGTIQSSDYLHIERTGEGLGVGWTTQERPLREPIARSNPIDDERRFWLRQIATGADEGIALMIEHEAVPVAMIAASQDHEHATMRVHDIRVDFDVRRQGLATALLFQVITAARELELRAVAAETSADNFPSIGMLSRCGFELNGLDTRRHTNHDLVKETVALFWYAPLD